MVFVDPKELLQRIRAEKAAAAAKLNGDKIILDPRDPMHSARALVATQFTTEGQRFLHHHRGSFWRFETNHYAPIDSEAVRAAIWAFLESAMQIGTENKPVPFKPTRSRVSDVVDALASACNVDM